EAQLDPERSLAVSAHVLPSTNSTFHDYGPAVSTPRSELRRPPSAASRTPSLPNSGHGGLLSGRCYPPPREGASVEPNLDSTIVGRMKQRDLPNIWPLLVPTHSPRAG